jgi:hypothetical protein
MFVVATIASVAVHAWGQAMTNAAPSEVSASPPAAVEKSAEDEWSFALSASTYFVPDHHDYVQPTVTADRGWLHLEARYNYEALDTASTWIGYNFAGGHKLAWEFTPKVGGVFGGTTGVAAGYSGSLTWWKLEFYSEGEYLYDVRDPSGSFLYSWSELTIAPVEWLRIGLAEQRTRTDHAEKHVQPGIVLGITHDHIAFSTYVFDLDKSKPTVVLALSVHF